jgi:hypothetical protein
VSIRREAAAAAAAAAAGKMGKMGKVGKVGKVALRQLLLKHCFRYGSKQKV